MHAYSPGTHPGPKYRMVVHTKERRLDLFRDEMFFKSYPIAVGRPSTPTPKGNFKIVNKDSRPGPRFGARWLGLSAPHIGIHGTNHPQSIGQAVSEGCVRLHNPDIEELYWTVPIGTPVSIV